MSYITFFLSINWTDSICFVPLINPNFQHNLDLITSTTLYISEYENMHQNNNV